MHEDRSSLQLITSISRYLDHSDPAGSFVPLFHSAWASFQWAFTNPWWLATWKFILCHSGGRVWILHHRAEIRCLQRCAPSRNSRKESLLLLSTTSSYCKQSLAVYCISVLLSQHHWIVSLLFSPLLFLCSCFHTHHLCIANLPLLSLPIKTPVLGFI